MTKATDIVLHNEILWDKRLYIVGDQKEAVQVFVIVNNLPLDVYVNEKETNKLTNRKLYLGHFHQVFLPQLNLYH